VLAVHLDSCGVTLEAQLSSPIMGLFANLVPLDISMRVLDRFVLFGEDGLLDIVKASFESQKLKILKLTDPFELQMYLTR
jgi:hypothetical protein